MTDQPKIMVGADTKDPLDSRLVQACVGGRAGQELPVMVAFAVRLFISASHPTVTRDARETGRLACTPARTPYGGHALAGRERGGLRQTGRSMRDEREGMKGGREEEKEKEFFLLRGACVPRGRASPDQSLPRT